MPRQLLLLLLAFAINLGVAFGVGQLCFAATLVWILLRD